MPTICIRLDPGRLPDADADLRYALPDALAELSAGRIADDGYDYGTRSGHMLVFLHVVSLDDAMPVVLDVIERVPVMGCLLRDGAVVAVADADHCDVADAYTVMFPRGYTDHFTLD